MSQLAQRQSMIRAVVFDCDGVLFHSELANLRFYNTVLAGLGLPPLSAEGERLAMSMASPQLIELLFPDPELRAEVSRAATNTDYAPFYEWMQPVDGLHDLLAALRRDYRLGMASNRGKTIYEVAARFDLEQFFEISVGTLDVARPKPHPDMLLKVLVHLGAQPHEGVFVGDQDSDRLAAEAAGMHFVGIGEESQAQQRIEHVRDLPSVLAHLG